MGFFDIAGTVVKTAAKCTATVGLTAAQGVAGAVGILGGIASTSPKGSDSDRAQMKEFSNSSFETIKKIQKVKDEIWK